MRQGHSKIISVHSFRGGTGKSNITANLAYLLASAGKKVAILDGDIASPGIHILFGIDESTLPYTLNDFLWGLCSIREATVDVSNPNLEGKLYVIPSRLNAAEIVR